MEDYVFLLQRKFPWENGISWKVVQNSQTEFPTERKAAESALTICSIHKSQATQLNPRPSE